MRTLLVISLLLALLAPTAHGDEDGPGELRLSVPSSPDPGAARRKRGRGYLVTGEVFLALAGLNLAMMAGAFVYATHCDTTQFHDSDCSLAAIWPIIGTAASALIGSVVGVALLSTGLLRIRDAERLRLAPTFSAHGGGLGLSFDF
jgi:hypothetical protein